ncbi:MAG: 50S ribosomal protein L29 [Planctomycetes bacterium]|nr:50S ribosomal protein L29 [Planctomycetota bacterium]
MKAVELRGMVREDLRRELKRLQQELFNINFQWQTEENPNSSEKKRLRKDIARYKTVLREMELAGQKEDAQQ